MTDKFGRVKLELPHVRVNIEAFRVTNDDNEEWISPAIIFVHDGWQLAWSITTLKYDTREKAIAASRFYLEYFNTMNEEACAYELVKYLKKEGFNHKTKQHPVGISVDTSRLFSTGSLQSTTKDISERAFPILHDEQLEWK